MKYLVVDMDRVLNECEAGRAALSSLKAFRGRVQEQRQELLQSVRRASNHNRKEAQKALREFDASQQELLLKRKAALQDALEKQALDIVQQLAAERGVQTVLHKQAVIVGAEDADCTDEILTRLNNHQ